MTDPVFLARLIGPVMLAFGIGILINRAYYRAMAEEMLGSRPLNVLSAILIMTTGLAIILSTGTMMWTLNWPALLIILAWLAFVGGAARLVFPEQMAEFGRSKLGNPQFITIGGVIWVVIGVILCLAGYLR
jgi:hypothetical protein